MRTVSATLSREDNTPDRDASGPAGALTQLPAPRVAPELHDFLADIQSLIELRDRVYCSDLALAKEKVNAAQRREVMSKLIGIWLARG